MTSLIGAFRWVLAATIPGCMLVLLILFVKKLFSRRVGASFHYGIWFLLIIRLLLPFSVSSPVSALNLLKPLENIVQSGEALHPQWSPGGSPKAAVPPKTTGKLPHVSVTEDDSKQRNTNTAFSYTFLGASLTMLWLSGTLIYFTYALTLNLRFIIQLKKSKSVSDARIQDIYRECTSILHISAAIPILSTEIVNSPSLYGILRPKLLMPRNLSGQMSDEELKYIILHELAHWKKKDIPVIWVTVILKALYWFNPFIWYAFYRMRQDCEVSCDALVLSHIRPEERGRYGHLLLHLSELGIRRKAAPAAACILSNNKNCLIKRRVVMISGYKRPTRKQIVLTALLVAGIAVTGLTGAMQAPASAQSVFTGASLTRSFDSAIIPSGKDAASDWAAALAQRNGAFRFALLSDELKQKEYPEHTRTGWIIGFSSPWVTGYTVREDGQSGAGTKYVIDYSFSDSTRAKYVGSETITVKQEGPTWQVVQHENLDYGYPALTEVPGFVYAKVQENQANLLPNGTAQGAASLWAEALKERNGAFRFSVLDLDLQKAEGNIYQKMNWVIGGSSPWVTDYTVTSLRQDKDSAQYRIDYQLTDSTRSSYHSTERISLKNNGGNWVVTKHDNYTQMPDFK